MNLLKKLFSRSKINFKDAHYSIHIFGERCSGTNYLESLIDQNLILNQEKIDLKKGIFGYKHWLIDSFDKIHDTDSALFLVVARNPVNWLTSMTRTPFHAAEHLHGLKFSQFIRAEWSCIWDEIANVSPSNPKFGKEMMHERNPHSQHRFKNPLALRTEKLSNWLKISNHNSSFIKISYEELVDNPEHFIAMLGNDFGFKTSSTFKNIISTRGFGNRQFKPKIQPVISSEDAQFIIDSLDWKVESKFGYSPNDVLKYIR